MKDWKYKIGQEVTYKTLKVEDITCECCGHIETDYKTIERHGRITGRMRDYVISEPAPFTIHREAQTDGTTLCVPVIGELKAPVKENFYTINGESVYEGSIKRKK
ncbi:hypothetical protein LCGC14_0964750 [marine sediment metagenome]|uniref:Uncharacterized protein n=1 Tax=marine sediment metagenome TaxID=412755 RepID=A0A0F9NDI4_9ZZZZ